MPITADSSPSLLYRQSGLALDELLVRATEIADFCAANAAAIDHNGAFPVLEFERIAKVGLLATPLQPEYGGLGLGVNAGVTYELLMLLKQMGRGNLAVGRIYEGHVNALQLIQTFGTREQMEVYASDARDRHKIFGVWNAEAEDGVKVYPLEGRRYRLEGSKTFCSGSGFVDRPFVNGPLGDEPWQMCIVPMEAVATVSDPTWWQPSGMRATASFKVDFGGVELDANALIGKPGDYFRQPWLTTGVIRFAAVQLGGAEALFDATRQYLRDLNRTSDPYQQERLGRMAIALESGNLWLRSAAAFVQSYAPIFGGDPDQLNDQADKLVAYTNMVRTAIEQICMDVMQLCERSVGTRGLLPPYPMERIIRDLTLYLRQPVFDAALSNAGQYALSQTNAAHSCGLMMPTVSQPSLLNPAALPLRSVHTITGSALVVAPHPDDETLGCGGAIALLRALGYPVYILVISDGTLSHPRSLKYPAPRLQALREAETLEALSTLGIGETEVTFLRLLDGSIPTSASPSIRGAVARCRVYLEALMPETIFLPWRFDPHPDHRATWELICTALVYLNGSPRIIEYPIWDWDLEQQGNSTNFEKVVGWRLDIQAVLETKLRAIAAYRSQITNLIDDDPEGFQLTPEMLANFAHPWEVYLEDVQ